MLNSYKVFYVDTGVHPLLGQVFHKCQKASGGDDALRYQRYLGNTLSNIAPNIEDCDRILGIVDTYDQNLREEILIEGEEVGFVIEGEVVQVNINIFHGCSKESEDCFSLAEVKKVLSAWRCFLEKPESLGSEMVIDL